MAINKKLYTQEIDATMTILQMCIILDKYVRLLIDSKEEKTDVTEKLKVIQDQINIIKTNVEDNTNDVTIHTNSIIQINNQVTLLNKLLLNYKELNVINLQDLIKGSNDITVDLDPTQEHVIIKLDQDIKDNITNLNNNVTTLLSDVSDNTNNINNIKLPIAPISINSEGKLYLNFGDGLEVDNNGKLKSTSNVSINSITVSGSYNYKYAYSINDNKIIIPPLQSNTSNFYMNSTYIGGYTTIPINDTIISGNSYMPTYFYNDNDITKKIPTGIDYRHINDTTGDYTNGGFQYNFMLPYLEYETKYNTSPIKYKMETIEYQDPTGGISNIKQPRLYLEYNENDFNIDVTNGKLQLNSSTKKQLNSSTKKYINYFIYANRKYGGNIDNGTVFGLITEKEIKTYEELLDYCYKKNQPRIYFITNNFIMHYDPNYYMVSTIHYIRNNGSVYIVLFDMINHIYINEEISPIDVYYSYSYEI